MPTASSSALSFIGMSTIEAGQLARSLAAERAITCPEPPLSETWEWDWTEGIAAWTDEVTALPMTDRVVVCTWPEPVPPVALAELDADQWRRQVEWPSALWFSTLVTAAGRCCDGGSVVVVVDRPAPLDAVGHGAAVTVAEGVVNVVRSLAAREGGRGVRVNAVATALQTDVHGLLGSPPPLASFPGRVDVEVAGAVRLLLSDDAVGITGTTVAATSGRR